MIFRALFWIALVSVLMPHEPDLGFGRPHFGASLPAKISDWAQHAAAAPGGTCESHASTCAAGLALLDSFQSVAVRSLADVKADIEENRKEDFIRRHAI
jgi:hypothetical protein